MTILVIIVAAVGVTAFVAVQSRPGRRKAIAASMFRDRYRRCVACGEQPFGHLSFIVGMAICSRTPNRVAELEQLIAARNWAAASAIMEFEGLHDEMLYQFIKCPATGEIAMKKIVSLTELYANDTLLEDMRLTAAEQGAADAFVAGRWETLPQAG